MKIVKQLGSLIIHKKRLNTKLKYKSSRGHKEEGVSVDLHDVVLLLGVAAHLLICKVHLSFGV